MFGPGQSAAWRRGASVALVQPERGTPPREDKWQLVTEWQATPGQASPVTVSVDVVPAYKTFLEEDLQAESFELPPRAPRELWVGASTFVDPTGFTGLVTGWDGALKVEYGSGGGAQTLICDVRSGTFALPASEHVRVLAQRWNLLPGDLEPTIQPPPQDPGESMTVRVALAASASPVASIRPTWTIAHLGWDREGGRSCWAPPRAIRADFHSFEPVLVLEGSIRTEPWRGAQHAFTDSPLALAVQGMSGIGTDARYSLGWASLGGNMLRFPENRQTAIRFELAT